MSYRYRLVPSKFWLSATRPVPVSVLCFNILIKIPAGISDTGEILECQQNTGMWVCVVPQAPNKAFWPSVCLPPKRSIWINLHSPEMHRSATQPKSLTPWFLFLPPSQNTSVQTPLGFFSRETWQQNPSNERLIGIELLTVSFWVMVEIILTFEKPTNSSSLNHPSRIICQVYFTLQIVFRFDFFF